MEGRSVEVDEPVGIFGIQVRAVPHHPDHIGVPKAPYAESCRVGIFLSGDHEYVEAVLQERVRVGKTFFAYEYAGGVTDAPDEGLQHFVVVACQVSSGEFAVVSQTYCTPHLLRTERIFLALVSPPVSEWNDQQDKEYRNQILEKFLGYPFYTHVRLTLSAESSDSPVHCRWSLDSSGDATHACTCLDCLV